MGKLFWYLHGYLLLEITGASPDGLLNRLSMERIPFWGIWWVDSFTVRICVLPKDMRRLEKLAEKTMCQARVLERLGLKTFLKKLAQRPCLVVMMAVSILAVTILPGFLFFYEVTGNETVDDAQILRVLQEHQVGFGTFGATLDPKWIKDHVLQSLPQLQWITVTQNGCRAQVVVRERLETPETEDRKAFSNVIATQSGIITKQDILAGQAVHEVGDAVMKGELLVSGLVDLEGVYGIENAKAEIYAQTWRKIDSITPKKYLEKQYSKETSQALWLIVGQKRIKIFGNSGISTASCDKMIDRKILSLPGGLEFPLAVEIETCAYYEPAACEVVPEEALVILGFYSEQRVQGEMTAGEIRKRTDDFSENGEVYRLQAVLECHEMIARSVEAKWNEEEWIHD